MDLVSFLGGLTISCLPILLHHCVGLFRALTMLGWYKCECMVSIHNIIIGITNPTQLVSKFSYSVKLIFDGYHYMKNLCILKLLVGSVLC